VRAIGRRPLPGREGAWSAASVTPSSRPRCNAWCRISWDVLRRERGRRRRPPPSSPTLLLCLRGPRSRDPVEHGGSAEWPIRIARTQLIEPCKRPAALDASVGDRLRHEPSDSESLAPFSEASRQQGHESQSDVAETRARQHGAQSPADPTVRGRSQRAVNAARVVAARADPLTVQRAAREFAKEELADHRYVMVLHDHQANPHVHLSVRAESNHGDRLNPRKADLQRWRKTFAERLRGWRIDAESGTATSRYGA
jgi:hypothetical protein